MKKKISGKNNFIFSDKFQSLFFKYFSVFVLLIVLPAVLLGTVAYKSFYDNLNREIGKANANTLDQTLQSIDVVLRNIEGITDLYAADPFIIKYTMTPTLTELKDISAILHQLSSISSSPYVHSVYLYNGYDSSVISPGNGVTSFGSFFDKGWMTAYENADSSLVWMDTRTIKYSEHSLRNCITLIRTLPLSTADPLGAIIINIDEDRLSSILEKEKQNGVLMYISNEEGEMISHPQKEKLYHKVSMPIIKNNILNSDKGYFVDKSNGSNTLFVYSTSKLTGWKYIGELSAAEPVEEAENTKRLTLLVIIIYVLFGTALAYYMAKRFYRPIRHLITDVVKAPGAKEMMDTSGENKRYDEYAILENAYSTLEASLKQTIPVMADKFFKEILIGKRVIDPREIEEHFKKYKMAIDSKDFVVMVLKIEKPYKQEDEAQKDGFSNIAELIKQAGHELMNKDYKGYVC